jgi:hypothetical protein
MMAHSRNPSTLEPEAGGLPTSRPDSKNKDWGCSPDVDRPTNPSFSLALGKGV